MSCCHKKPNNKTLTMTILPNIFLYLLLLFPVDCYHRGDVVDTILLTKKSSMASTMLQKDMPLFGYSTSSIVKNIEAPTFSLGFEDGLYMLPWVDTKRLEKLTVTFTFSGGNIHSVSSQKKISPTANNESFEIEYQWIEEAPLDIQSGMSVMYLFTLIISILFLVQACDATGSDEQINNYNDSITPTPRPVKYGSHGHRE